MRIKITNYKVELCETIRGEITCPLCKETKRYSILSMNAGGVEGSEYTWFKRRFRKLYKYSQKKYRCHTCSATWKGDIKKEKVLES